MKSLHIPGLWAWSRFDEARNIEFNSVLACLPTGNIAFDPLPLSAHDQAHVEALGGVAWVNISNADHVRDAVGVQQQFGARIGAPIGERGAAELAGVDVAHWFADEGELVDCGVRVLPVRGSKTPGEVAFVLPAGDTLICGDLVRGQTAGRLNILPDAKLSDRAAAIESVREMLSQRPAHVVVGDGWSVFHRGVQALELLLGELG
jgi:glyoxylase-like metal-dependent hydrolase (beta-lactamase superfamily II)